MKEPIQKKKSIIGPTFLLMMSVIFSLLVPIIDVQPIGQNGTPVGFAKFNQAVMIGLPYNNTLYVITEVLGYLAMTIVFSYALIGAIQLFKRKKILKVDPEILILGGLYIIVGIIYIVFNKFPINYRPVLIDGALEPSYPSSHMLLALCVFGSAIIINRKLWPKKTFVINILFAILTVATVVGRLLSGVHWCTDIIGGFLIASALVSLYDYLVTRCGKQSSSTSQQSDEPLQDQENN